jgi:hypothetical protein
LAAEARDLRTLTTSDTSAGSIHNPGFAAHLPATNEKPGIDSPTNRRRASRVDWQWPDSSARTGSLQNDVNGDMTRVTESI